MLVTGDAHCREKLQVGRIVGNFESNEIARIYHFTVCVGADEI